MPGALSNFLKDALSLVKKKPYKILAGLQGEEKEALVFLFKKLDLESPTLSSLVHKGGVSTTSWRLARLAMLFLLKDGEVPDELKQLAGEFGALDAIPVSLVFSRAGDSCLPVFMWEEDLFPGEIPLQQPCRAVIGAWKQGEQALALQAALSDLSTRSLIWGES